MLKASQNPSTDTSASGPSPSPAPYHAQRPVQQADASPFAVVQADPPVIDHGAEIYTPLSWSDSLSSPASADSRAPAPFHWVAELDERGISLLDTSFYGFEDQGLDESFLASDTLDLLTSLSLDSMQLHVYSSPSRPLPAGRQGHGLPAEAAAAERFDTQNVTALEFEPLPLAYGAVQTTGCRTASGLESQDAP